MPVSGSAARSAKPAQASAFTRRASSFGAEDALGTPEHHRDKEREGDDVAPLDVEEEPADRDELGKDERGDQAAQHVAQAAQHADEEHDRSEGEPDRRMDVVL